MFTKKPIFRFASVFLLIVVAVAAAFPAGDVDLGFSPYVARTNSRGESVTTSAVQPDGKLLIGGSFTVVGKHPFKSLARLNADGTVDTSFHSLDIDSYYSPGDNDIYVGSVHAVAVQPDGKIWISGNFDNLDGINCPKLARLNADGTPDIAFNAELQHQLRPGGTILRINVLPNGQVLLGGYFGLQTLNNGYVNQPISRINADGSFDPTFNTSAVQMTCHDMDVLPDGRIMIAGGGRVTFNYVGLARLHPTGAIDFSFSGVHLNNFPHPHAGYGNIYDFKLLPNGQIIIGGFFGTVNGVSRENFARINPDGLLDTTFNHGAAGTNGTISTVDVTPEGKILLGGVFNTYNGASRNRLAMLNANGTLDTGFNYTQPNFGVIRTTYLFPDGRIFAGGNTEGIPTAEEFDWDKSAILTATGAVLPQKHLVGSAGVINSIVQQPDGKVLIGGRFEGVNGKRRTNIARLNPDGTLDESFTAPVYPEVIRLALQADGKVIAASGAALGPIRLNTDGTKDLSFSTPVTGIQRDIAVTSDGKVIIVGELTVPSAGSQRIVRLNENGSVDATFVIPEIADGWVRRVLLQPDGKILILGFFRAVDGVPVESLARLNANGTRDPTFFAINPNFPFINNYNDMALQPDGKLVVVGNYGGSTPNGYAGRFNPNGSFDVHFATSSTAPQVVAVQPDGKILLGGSMTNVEGLERRGIARLKSDGSVDLTFATGSGANDRVTAIATQTNGKILVGGEFSRFDRKSNVGLVRLNSASISRTPFDFDGDGKSDISVFRPTGNRWFVMQSGSSAVVQTTFGSAGNVRVPADYDGDGKTDEAVFNPSTGNWSYRGSVDPDFVTEFHWGLAGDIPRPSDFDGDGKDDLVVFRPSNSVWYRFGSTGAISVVTFGISGDKPVIGDFDGDGRSDHAVYRPSTGDWWYTMSGTPGEYGSVHWGASGDIPIPADYDGDSRTDLAVYRPSEARWYIRNSSNGSVLTTAFGLAEDRPVAADYDGDGRADIAVFRPSTGVWYLMGSTAGFSATQFGLGTDEALPGSFVP